LPELKLINEAFIAKKINFNTAFNQVKDIREQLNRQFKRKYNYNKENMDILEEFWDHRYADKDIKDKQSAKNRLIRAVSRIEDLSLMTATKKQLQLKIATEPQQRRLAAALNQLLQFLGRGKELLSLNRPKRSKPRYLNYKEFKLMLANLECEHKDLVSLLCTVAYGTGLRQAELFAITKDDLRKKGFEVMVSKQLNRDNELDEETKTGKNRIAIVNPRPEFVKALIKWASVPMQVREVIPREGGSNGLAKVVKDACQRIFTDKNKNCVFHDLRHSYAKQMLLDGLHIVKVAQSLGNNPIVCAKYYTGIEHDEDSADDTSKQWAALVKAKKN
jgi:integrase